jgi:hypothetical protein
MLPVSSLVNVQVVLTPPLAQFPNLSTALILGSSSVIDPVTRMRSYGTLAAVAAAFGTSAAEYKTAALWFEQSPQPTSLRIGRWVKTDAPGQLFGGTLDAANQLIGPWAAINNGAFAVTINGAGPQQIGNLDFTAQVNLNGVAAVIESGLPGGTATCVYDAANHRFVITSVATGANAEISFLAAPAAGTDISDMMAARANSAGAYVSAGLDAETAVAAATLLDVMFSGQWYGLIVPEAVDADHLDLAEYVEGSGAHVYGITTQDDAALSPSSTTDIAYLVHAAGYNRTAVQYSSKSAYAVASFLARILTTNWAANNSTITLMYKQEPGISFETLTETQAAALQAKDANVFVGYNNDTAIIQFGTMASGQFADTVIGVDWLRGQIQTNLFNLLYGANKIPQTDDGNHLLATGIEAACAAGVNNGLLAPGAWNAGGFGQLKQGGYLDKGYYIYSPPIALQAPADRAARKSVTFQVAAKLAGAVHTADVVVNVNT